ncbi:MAG: SpoIID/LytB domain-containing protein [Bacillota bacterium]|nr:SpoIID/LytB domain-containing protein [Bacillota bacterium]
MSGYDVRVLLHSSSAECSYTLRIEEGTYLIQDERGMELGLLREGDSVSFSYEYGRYWIEWSDAAEDSAEPLMILSEDPEARFSLGGKSYRGGFKLMMNNSYCYGINIVDIELYLYGVVGRELGYNYHEEALKAQAVASRSYALANVSSSNVFYDVTATTSSQVYGGYSAESEAVRRAVDETRGQVLIYGNELVPAYYSSNAGGHTENIENVWNSDEIPFIGVPSPHDEKAGNYSSYGASCYSWTVDYGPADLVRLANAYGKTDIGSYKGISISQSHEGQSSVSGRAMELSIHGTKDSVTATKYNICSLLNLKSNLISISDSSGQQIAGYVLGADGQTRAWESFEGLYAIGAAFKAMLVNGNADSFYVYSGDGVKELAKKGSYANGVRISGKGYGHGVGMSQWGAIAMADEGYSWEEIIAHYYCGAGVEISEYY